MHKLLNEWRFYGLGEAEYKEALDKVFTKNILGLLRANIIVVIILAGLTIVPLFIDKNITKTIFFLSTGTFAALMYIIVKYKFHPHNKGKKLKKSHIYTLIFLSYANVVALGIYLGVWANPGRTAGSFLAILICALLLFNIPPIYHFFLTVISVIVFILIVIMVKAPAEHAIDIPNALLAGTIGIFFGWQIIMNRLSLMSISNRMEEERNSYYNQSTVDELTQLKNRRDFMNTFQRYLVNHQETDRFLCIALLDIDFFKSYNDHYGHIKGDKYLRKIGNALKELHDKMNIYAARISGEEFALVWFEKEAVNAQVIASQISGMIYDLNIPHEKSPIAPYVTVSIGIYVVRCDTSNNIYTLYDLADKALYTAKKNGRNRVVVSLSDHLHIELLRDTA
jgi:diguanylate cyclase (GGDEF)-like protein